ncbi:MAG: glycosyltransferase family 4 protein, partial [Steroidobacteraceae bacterium]
NGVDVTLFRPPTPAERASARIALDVAPGKPVLLYIGRFVAKKGLPLLHSLARDFPEGTWLFAGDGQIPPEAWNLPNVRVYRDRERESLRELVWASDLLLLPSESEGFPLVVQEALASGLPSLVTSDIAEGYPPSRAALLLESLGEGAHERWLARLRALANGTETVPSAADLAAFAQEHWNWDRAVATYREIIEELEP